MVGKLTSWALLPTSVGMSACRPEAKASRGALGTIQPSTIGPAKGGPGRNLSAGSLRSSVRLGAPSLAARPAPAFSEVAREAMAPGARESSGAMAALLSPIAPEISPLASGETSRSLIIIDPADWPKTVTCDGSPPSAAALRLIHRRTAIASISP